MVIILKSLPGKATKFKLFEYINGNWEDIIAYIARSKNVAIISEYVE